MVIFINSSHDEIKWGVNFLQFFLFFPVFTCTTCAQEFRDVRNLMVHAANAHPNEATSSQQQQLHEAEGKKGAVGIVGCAPRSCFSSDHGSEFHELVGGGLVCVPCGSRLNTTRKSHIDRHKSLKTHKKRSGEPIGA